MGTVGGWTPSPVIPSPETLRVAVFDRAAEELCGSCLHTEAGGLLPQGKWHSECKVQHLPEDLQQQLTLQQKLGVGDGSPGGASFLQRKNVMKERISLTAYEPDRERSLLAWLYSLLTALS